MPDMLYQFMHSLLPKTVQTAFCASVGSALVALEPYAKESAPIVIQSWKSLPGEKKLLRQIVDGIAEIALAIWPRWYDQNLEALRSPLMETEGLPIYRRLSGSVANLSVLWLKKAIKKAIRGELPTVSRKSLSYEAQLHQLALTLSLGKLRIVLAVTGLECSPHLGQSLARIARLLAVHCPAGVALLLPDSSLGKGEWDSVAYQAIHLPVCDVIPEMDDAGTDKQAYQLCFLGKPHPCSPGEQEIAKQLGHYPQLQGLFEFNKRIRLSPSREYTVDMVWEAGRLIVEVDGYQFHSSRVSFVQDRRRDRDFVLNQYRIMRFAHSDVMADPALVMHQIAEAVNTPYLSPLYEDKR